LDLILLENKNKTKKKRNKIKDEKERIKKNQGVQCLFYLFLFSNNKVNLKPLSSSLLFQKPHNILIRFKGFIISGFLDFGVFDNLFDFNDFFELFYSKL